MEYIELLYKIRNYLFSFGIIMYFVDIKKFDICLQNVNDEQRFSSPKFSFLKSDNKSIYILDKPDNRIKYMYGSIKIFLNHHSQNTIKINKNSIKFYIDKESGLYEFCIKNYQEIFGINEHISSSTNITLYLYNVNYTPSIVWLR